MEYTFVSAVHETFSEFDHISYQISLNQRVQIIIFVLSDYNGTSEAERQADLCEFKDILVYQS